jgi:hypothetical protein
VPNAQPEAAIRNRFRSRLRICAPEIRVVGIPNAGKRGQWAVNQLKREGVATGFPDDMLLWPNGGVAFVEWKVPGGKLSLNQTEWLQRLTAMGHRCIVGVDPDQVIDWLTTLGAPILFRRAA